MKYNFVIFDIETDDVNATVIRCLSYTYLDENKEWVKGTITNPDRIPSFMSQFKKFICHNLIRFDMPVLEKLTGFKTSRKNCVDTLGLSWKYFPEKNRHGLEAWGEHFGVPKPVIEDFKNQPLEDIIHRCEEDVEINRKLYLLISKRLRSIYGDDIDTIRKSIEYIGFKMYCLKLMEDSPFRLDIAKTEKFLARMELRLAEKREELVSVMPRVPKRAVRKKPSKIYKINGDPSAQGQKWLDLLAERNLPEDYEGEIEYIKEYRPPNPNSSQQVKDWLFSLGWKPTTFKFVREDDGSNKAIAQVNDGGKLCQSVILLAEKKKEVRALEGYSVLKARSGMLKGFLRDCTEDGFITASAHGFTNTMRLKHKTLVNLPGVTGKNDAADGVWIRGCLTATEGKELCGADITSLEDSTKQHYMYDYDPKYVEEMNAADYDPHIEIGLIANMITKEEATFFKESKERDDLSAEEKKKLKKISNARKKAKVTNFSSIYGVGAKKLSLTVGCTVKEAEKLLKAYWKRNWSVKKVAENQLVIEVGKQMWLKNPVNGFYYNLRYEKDIFSTLNQGTGVYVFDTWLEKILDRRPQLTAQFHDEIVLDILKGKRKSCDRLLEKAMDELNEELKLNVKVRMETAYGHTYADVH